MPAIEEIFDRGKDCVWIGKTPNARVKGNAHAQKHSKNNDAKKIRNRSSKKSHTMVLVRLPGKIKGFRTLFNAQYHKDLSRAF